MELIFPLDNSTMNQSRRRSPPDLRGNQTQQVKRTMLPLVCCDTSAVSAIQNVAVQRAKAFIEE
jgi:hypothetical protein